jgi:hypothetical protein
VLIPFRIAICQWKRTYVTKYGDLIHKWKDTLGGKIMVSEFRRGEIEVFNSIVVSFYTLNNCSLSVDKTSMFSRAGLPSSHNEA